MASYDKVFYECIKLYNSPSLKDLEPQYLGDDYSENVYMGHQNIIAPIKTKNPFLFDGYTALHYKMIFNVTTYLTLEYETKYKSIYRIRWLRDKALFNKEMSQSLDNYIELFSTTIYLHILKLVKLNEPDTLIASLNTHKLFQKYYYTAVINLRRIGLLTALEELYTDQCEKIDLIPSGQFISHTLSPDFNNGNINYWADFWYDAFNIFICWITKERKLNSTLYNKIDDGQDFTDN